VANEKLTLGIDVQTTGQQSVDTLTNSLSKVVSISERAAKNSEGAFSSFGSELAPIGRDAVKAAEGLTALVASHTLYTAAIARYSSTAIAGASSTDTLVNSYRGVRLALSPTPFTVATVAIGFLTEETIRLTNARARLIEQQSLISATTGLSVGAIQRIDATANLSGGSAANLRSLYSSLSARIDNQQSSVRSGLNTLGISSSLGRQGESVDPALLQKIAEGFTSIEDPVKRAAAAVQLFGDDKAGEALRELGFSFVDASNAANKYGVTLDSLSRNQIFTARQDFLRLKDSLTDFSDIKGWWNGVETGAEIVAAATEDMAKRGAKALDDFIGRTTGLRGALAPLLTLPSTDLGSRQLSIRQGLVADDLFAQAQGTRVRQGETLEGQRSAQSDAQARADSAYSQLAKDAEKRRLDPHDPSLLGGDARFALATQQQSAAAVAVSIGEKVKAMEASQQASADADALATRTRRAQSEALLSSRETLARSNFDPSAGKNLSDNLRRASSFVDEEGELHKFTLLDETRRNLEGAFQAYVVNATRKTSEAQIASEEESFRRRQGFEDALFTKRQQFSAETARMDLGTIDKTFAHQNTKAGYARDAAVKDSEIGGIGLTGTDAAQYSITQIQRRKEIESRYLTSTSITDSEAITRARDRQLQTVAADRYTGNITDDQYFDRRDTINSAAGQQGATLNDKYAHDLLALQQDAVEKTTEIIKSLENEQIDKFKSAAGGLFDAATSRQPRAIPDFLRSQGLDVARTITENLAGEAFKSFRSAIPHATSGTFFGKALEGTPFGPKVDPLHTSATALDGSQRTHLRSWW